MPLRLTHRAAIIRKLYGSDPRPWVVAFSGGKDSTAVLQLVWWALEALPPDERTKEIHVCYVDTGMEYPSFAGQINSTLDAISMAASRRSMPFVVHRLEPELKHRYFTAVIGRGYAPPTHWFRWCTKGMRVRPMNRFIRQTLDEHGAAIVVLGLRSDESQARRETLRKFAMRRRFLGRYGTSVKATAFTPIEDLETDEVWQFLMQFPCPWGGQNRSLARIYREGAGECLTHAMVGGQSPSCGGSRFGCWTCTVVRKDKAGAGLAEHDDRYVDLLAFRDWLAHVRYDKRARWLRRRNGQPGPGPVRLSVRREMLRRVFEIERSTGFNLLRSDEVQEIQRLWALDGDRGNSALAMCKALRSALPQRIALTAIAQS